MSKVSILLITLRINCLPDEGIAAYYILHMYYINLFVQREREREKGGGGETIDT